MKKLLSVLLAIMVFVAIETPIYAKSGQKSGADDAIVTDQNETDLGLDVKGAYLIEAKTGKVLYSENELVSASPASVTKIMTLLLVCEALDAGKFQLSDMVTVSAYAAGMGGSQVFLEEGERMSVEELIKCTVIASANDAAVALAELTAGSEEAFVRAMNKRASELGLKATSFENTTGLDDTTVNHYSCAADIATMSRELIKHDIILKYSSIWQDSIRNGSFTLTNTNRLVRYYDGCNGLKTGSTDKAGYCVSTTAKRGNMQLIAVIMGAKSRDARNAAARRLLDYGFANFSLFEKEKKFIENVPVLCGKSDFIPIVSGEYFTVLEKGKASGVEEVYEIPENISAPINEGDVIGKIIYRLDGVKIGESDILAGATVEKIDFWGILVRILSRIVSG